MHKPHRPVRVTKLPRVMYHRIAPAMKIFGTFGLLFAMVPCLYQLKVYIIRKLRVWRAQKCNFLVSAKTEPTVVGQQTTPCLAAPYGQTIEIFKISGLPIDMVPCLHQCNAYNVKRLRVWRAQKCNFLISAKTEPTIVGQQTTPCLAAPYGQGIEIFKISGLPIDMVPCLNQCNVYIKRKLRVWRAQICDFLVSAKTAPTRTSQQTTPCLVASFLVSIRNFQNFGATYRHGNVFAPMKCYIVRKLRVWRAQKCNLLASIKTAPTGTGEQTISSFASPYWVSNRNLQNYGAAFCHGTVLHHCKVYIERKLRVRRAEKRNFLVSANTTPTGACQQTITCLAAPYLASNRNFQNFVPSYRHGTVFAAIQCLYCKEATGVESPKMQFTSQCKNRTDRYGSTNFPVSCSAISSQQ